MLPFAEAKDNTLLKSMNRCIKRTVPNDVNTRITSTGFKLNTRFQIKDKTAQIYKHDLIYYVKCPDQSCNQDYSKLFVELLRGQLIRMVKINIHIYH